MTFVEKTTNWINAPFHAISHLLLNRWMSNHQNDMTNTNKSIHLQSKYVSVFLSEKKNITPLLDLIFGKDYTINLPYAHIKLYVWPFWLRRNGILWNSINNIHFFVYTRVGSRYVTNLKSLTIRKRNILCVRKMQQKKLFLEWKWRNFLFLQC